MQGRTDDRTLGDLFAELSRETGDLVRKELELAKTEMAANARTAGSHAGLVAAGGALVHAGLLVLLGAIVTALVALGLPAWVSALIVAAVVMIAGYVLVTQGLTKLRTTSVAPKETMETLRENARWTTRTRA